MLVETSFGLGGIAKGQKGPSFTTNSSELPSVYTAVPNQINNLKYSRGWPLTRETNTIMQAEGHGCKSHKA